MPRYKLTIEYAGTHFIGWQAQTGFLSIQGCIEYALQQLLKQVIKLFVAGRTDAGVHALGQVAHFDYPDELDFVKLPYSLNFFLRPHPIVIIKAESVAETFHARFSATQRSYTYKILNRQAPTCLDQHRVWWIRYPLDIEKLQQAASLLIGYHDFTTFRDSDCQSASPFKTIDNSFFTQHEDIISYHVSSRSFLHHQVRNMIGSLTLVGRNKWSLDQFQQAFKACDRRQGGVTAPASGLYLTHVTY